MRIHDGVHLVGSGNLGVDLSAAHDCNVYVIETSDGLVAIDSGCGSDLDLIVGNMSTDGLDVADLRLILLTHGHLDHVGGAAELARLSGARVYAAGELVEPLARADETLLDIELAKNAGLYPRELHLTPLSVEPMPDGDVVVGSARVTAIRTPGHSFGSLSFLVETQAGRNLFTGDALFWGGRLALQPIPTCDLVASIGTIQDAVGPIEGLYPGHGLFSVRRGQRHIGQALAAVGQLRVPAQLGE
jgi:glyoxylase-like metal-dependent hydrolase (beta-lactamase superfamily II)